jgi:DNA-binding SARP family transcriptional activator
MLTFRVLGAVTICGSDGSSVEVSSFRQRTLLIALLLHPNVWIPVPRLIDMVWGERPPKSAVNNLKTYVWRLRNLFLAVTGAHRVQSRSGGYRLVLDHGELDLHVFEDLALRGEQALIASEFELAIDLLTGALALWRSEPFDDAPAVLVESRITRLREKLCTAQEQLVQAHLALDQPDRALTLVRELLADQPLRERPWALLIRALTQADRRAEAVTAYREVCHLLDYELGLEPGPILRMAYQHLLSG